MIDIETLDRLERSVMRREGLIAIQTAWADSRHALERAAEASRTMLADDALVRMHLPDLVRLAREALTRDRSEPPTA